MAQSFYIAVIAVLGSGVWISLKGELKIEETG